MASSLTYDLDQTTESYSILLDNSVTEDKLNENEDSSASQFEVTLEPQLNLSPLLYMKSILAETMLDKLEISSLPLTFTRTETIKINVEIPSHFTLCNMRLSKEDLDAANQTPLSLQLEDYICKEPNDAVSFFNETIRHRINFFLISRYLNVAFDGDYLDVNSRTNFELNEIKLLIRWIDLCIWTRRVFHEKLCSYAGITDDDISDSIIFSNSSPLITSREESEIIAESSCIIAKDDRNNPRKPTLFDFEHFYGLNVANESANTELNKAKLNDIKTTVETQTLSWLDDIGFPSNPQDLEASDIEDIRSYLKKNKDLIDLVSQSRVLLILERQKHKGKRKNASIFQEEMCIADLDKNQHKFKFILNPQKFLAKNTLITIHLPTQMSYALGSALHTNISIGPLSTDTMTKNVPRLSNNIVSNHQSLPFGVRNLPTIIYIMTDIVSGKRRDSWQVNSIFQNFHVIFNHIFDETAITSRAITSIASSDDYYKLKDSNRLLETLSFAVVDQNFKKLHFSLKTYCRISLKVRPVIHS